MPKRTMKGKVISSAADKTVNVLVNTRVLHPVYKKYINSSKKFLAHDEANKFIIGDVIEIQESKPLSKRKTWIALKKIERS